MRLLLAGCGMKLDDQRILAILSKLGELYFVFISKFYSMKEAFEVAYKMPSSE